MTEQGLTNDNDEQWLNQDVIHPRDPTDTVQVTVHTYDINMFTISSLATTEFQQCAHRDNMSPATTEYHLKSGPQQIRLRLLSLTKESPDSPTPSNKGPTTFFTP